MTVFAITNNFFWKEKARTKRARVGHFESTRLFPSKQ
jgi:hypothetical protein